ncbi:MAG: S1 RNA-binding domain-containing protein [Lachnospiraceae bacterium]|nr:S1 RNA-binding domain-containing protein [Lachnospiraceae bacterium]
MAELNKQEAWENLEALYEEGAILDLRVEGIVNAGVIVYPEGIRGFIPVSQLAMRYVEDTNVYLHKMVQAKIIDLDEAQNRLVLSVREVEQMKRKEARAAKIASFTVGSVVEGKVDSIQKYGAFIDLGDRINGLVHISQFTERRIKDASEVVKVGDVIKVRVIKNEDGKISLSAKGLLEEAEPVEEKEPEMREYKEDGEAATSLASLLAGIQL